ncbi:MAG TPA: hypothetical protein VMF13_15245 [Luteitalea sp.]|nr:hypothetical protein [Luteitalea sp.]
MKPIDRRLTHGELQHLDGLITVLQEEDRRLDASIVQQDSCCCAITQAAHGRFEISARDRDLLQQIATLESQLESMPTLGQLVELRGQLLRQSRGGQ